MNVGGRGLRWTTWEILHGSSPMVSSQCLVTPDVITSAEFTSEGGFVGYRCGDAALAFTSFPFHFLMFSSDLLSV